MLKLISIFFAFMTTLMTLCDDNIIDIISFLPIVHTYNLRETCSRAYALCDIQLRLRLPANVLNIVDAYISHTGHTIVMTLKMFKLDTLDLPNALHAPQALIMSEVDIGSQKIMITTSDHDNEHLRLTKFRHVVFKKLAHVGADDRFDITILNDRKSTIFLREEDNMYAVHEGASDIKNHHVECGNVFVRTHILTCVGNLCRSCNDIFILDDHILTWNNERVRLHESHVLLSTSM